MNIQKAFQLLGLKENASADEAKQAYIASVKKYHPDRFQDDPAKLKIGEEMLKEINLAYAQLKTYFKEKPHTAQSKQTQSVKPDARQNTSKPNPSQAGHHQDAPKYSTTISETLKAIWHKLAQTVQTIKTQPEAVRQQKIRPKAPPHGSPHKSQSSQSFQHVLKEVETRMKKNPNTAFSNRKGTVNIRRKKTIYQNIGRWQKNPQDSNRVEPIRRVKRVGKIGEDD